MGIVIIKTTGDTENTYKKVINALKNEDTRGIWLDADGAEEAIWEDAESLLEMIQ